MKLVSVDQMKKIENEANNLGLSFQDMMENAGRGLAKEIMSIARSHFDGIITIFALVGPGNNGGDTLIALRELVLQNMDVKAFMIKRETKGDELLEQYIELGGRVISNNEDPDFLSIKECIDDCEILIDGVLGTGIKLPLRPEIELPMKKIKQYLIELEKRPIIVAVDCPSGTDNDTGEVAECTISADFTICMAAIKQGLLKLPAFEYVGKIKVIDIGLNNNSSTIKSILSQVADEDMMKSVTINRPLDSHKGTFGTAVIVAGSLNYTGAALLAGRAAYRVGVGLVNMAIPAILHSSLAGHFPEATWLLLPHEMGSLSGPASNVLLKNLGKADALLIGCGLGLEDTTYDFIERLLVDSPKVIEKTDGIGFVQNTMRKEAFHDKKIPPLVIDADGLKLLAKLSEWSKILPKNSILTPHVGEMEILTGVSKDRILSNRMSVAVHFAREWRQIVVLKGAFTIIASPEGATTTIPIATPALSRAGSGDVLAGMIVGFRAQGMDAYHSAIAGTWHHARAGVVASKRLGGVGSVMAGDIIEAINESISLTDYEKTSN